MVKIGGSLITDKTQAKAYRPTIASQIASEIKTVCEAMPSHKFIIGHGSGSFGHVIASEYNTINGVKTSNEWRGFAQVGNIASELSFMITQTFQKEGVPIWRIQPGASAIADNGRLISMTIEPIKVALANQIIPLIHGDVAIDLHRGGTIISTETIFFYLVKNLKNINQIILLGEVDGVYDDNQQVIPEITPQNFNQIKNLLGSSRGTDVTGGMKTKVEAMLNLTQTTPNLNVHIINGMIPGNLSKILIAKEPVGTHIHS